MKRVTKSCWGVLLLLLMAASLLPGLAGAVEVLYIVPDHFGANNYLFLDDLDHFGWHVTKAGVTEVVDNCSWAGQFHVHPMEMDLLISEVSDVTQYDAVIIGTVSRYDGNPGGELIADSDTIWLLISAHNAGIPVAAYCSGVRVLAAAGIIDGVMVSGASQYAGEYEEAGAIYVGDGLPPLLDQNIITGTRNMFNHLNNMEIIGDAIEQAEGGAR